MDFHFFGLGKVMENTFWKRVVTLLRGPDPPSSAAAPLDSEKKLIELNLVWAPIFIFFLFRL